MGHAIHATESMGHANHLANLPIGIPFSALRSPSLSHLADLAIRSNSPNISGPPLAHAARTVFQIRDGRIIKPMSGDDRGNQTWREDHIPKEAITEYGPNGSKGLNNPDTFVPYSQSEKLLGKPIAKKSLRNEMARTTRMLKRLEKKWQR